MKVLAKFIFVLGLAILTNLPIIMDSAEAKERS
jgi:hypothetical protein